jgi:predicted nucleic acid-binding protein
VNIPESVRNEVLPNRGALGEALITEALEQGWVTVWSQPLPHVLEFDLDHGETDCINLALHHRDNALLIMDERSGRAVAREQGIKLTGTAALIGIAKKMGLISSAKDAFERLHIHDFRIAPSIIRQILTSVNEI